MKTYIKLTIGIISILSVYYVFDYYNSNDELISKQKSKQFQQLVKKERLTYIKNEFYGNTTVCFNDKRKYCAHFKNIEEVEYCLFKNKKLVSSECSLRMKSILTKHPCFTERLKYCGVNTKNEKYLNSCRFLFQKNFLKIIKECKIKMAERSERLREMRNIFFDKKKI